MSRHRLLLLLLCAPLACVGGAVAQDAVGFAGITKIIFVSSLTNVQAAPVPWQREQVIHWLIGAGSLALAALIWIVLLVRKVNAQTSKLRESALELERFKTLADSTTDLVGMFTLDLKGLYMNPAGRTLLGIGQEEDVTLLAFDSFLAPDTTEISQRVGFQWGFEHGSWQTELNMLHWDGHAIPVSFVGLVVRAAGGAPLHMGCIARDLSARVAIEQQLRESNDELQRFKAVAEATSDCVGMGTLDLKGLYLNPAGRALLGIGKDEDVTRLSYDAVLTPEALELSKRVGFQHGYEHGSWQTELSMLHRDGHAIPVSFVGLIIKAADGTPLYMGSIARDLSARFEMERQLRQALDKERELHTLKSNFVNTISHEFRTPLGIILFAASMLRRFNDRFKPEQRLEQLAAIEAVVARMTDLVEQSLSLGRANAMQPENQQININALCRRIIDEVMSAAAHRSPVTFETNDDADGQAWCDESMLRTILINLVGNAVKYSPVGTLTELRLIRWDDRATFTVRDHGPGLLEEDIPKLFATFHRGSNTAGIPGTGLGLAIVKTYTEALGGSVIARNAGGGGAEFIVELPHFYSTSWESSSSSEMNPALPDG